VTCPATEECASNENVIKGLERAAPRSTRIVKTEQGVPQPGERRSVDLTRLFADLVEVEPALDPIVVARRAEKLVREALGIDLTAIYLARAQGELVAVGAVLLDLLKPEERGMDPGHPLVVRLREQRRPVRVEASQHANPHSARLLVERGVRMLVLTPLVAGERFLGLLAAARLTDAEMADIPDEVFQAIGRAVGVALEQARLLAEARARADADRALLEAARFAAGSGEGAGLDAILERYAEAITRVAGAQHGGIVVPDALDPSKARLAASFGMSAEELADLRSVPFSFDDPVIAGAFAAQKILTLDLTNATHEPGKRMIERRGTKHLIAVPLVARDVVRGVAYVGTLAPIDAAVENLLQVAGHETALAIETASERAAARRSAAREGLEHELRRTVRGSFDVGAVLEQAVEKLGRALGASRCYAGMGVPGRPSSRRVTNEWRARASLPSALDWRLDGTDRPIARAMARTGECVCHDVITDPRFGSVEANAPGDLRSFIIVSLLESDFSKGFLCVAETERPRRWQDDEVRLVHSVAEHCAIALRRAEINDDAKRRATELELTISQMTDAVITCNERLEVIRSNAAARSLLWGVTMGADSSGRLSVRDLEGREVKPEDYPIVRAVRFGEIVRDRELVFALAPDPRAGDTPRKNAGSPGTEPPRIDGSGAEPTKIIVSSASPLHDATGRLVGGVVVMKDVTEARAAAAYATRTEKLRVVGELAASVAHDLNNTLAAVLGSAELIEGTTSEQDVRRNAQVIAQAARDASTIMGRLTRLSSKTHATAHRDVLELADVADDALELTRARWGRPGSGIATLLEAVDPVRVRGVATELREVVTNLVLNAVDAMPRGGKIRVRVVSEAGSALLEVSDEGTGMSDEVLRHAFEPFFTTKGDTGTGLGLSISSAIVAAHGGTIDAASKPGQGTTIRVHLPLSEEPPPSPPAAAPGKRVLVVDDDARVKKLLVDFLVKEGHSVISASSGEEALRILESEGERDLLVTDFMMPGMSGLELAEAARSLHPEIALVVVSGFCGDAPTGELARLGARLVAKPFLAEELRSAVAAALQSPLAL
jgi:signal transduction histidine kinase